MITSYNHLFIDLIQFLNQFVLLSHFQQQRETVNQEFDKRQCLYAGFDPTADSLHFGNLLVLTTLIRFLRDGHQVICLIGNATIQIGGDPSDKASQRSAIDKATIEYNSNKISGLISSIFSNHFKYFWKKDEKTKDLELKDPIILENSSWYERMNVIDFFANIGKITKLKGLMSKKFVENRVKTEAGLTFSEFSYQIFQSYDWYHLMNKFDCRFQVCVQVIYLSQMFDYQIVSFLKYTDWWYRSDR